jgi:hypothetical protein
MFNACLLGPIFFALTISRLPVKICILAGQSNIPGKVGIERELPHAKVS